MKKTTTLYHTKNGFPPIWKPWKLLLCLFVFMSATPTIFALDEDFTTCNIIVTESGGVLNISGLEDNPTLKIFNADYSAVVYECNPFSGTACNETTEVIGLPNGNYIVRVLSNAPSSCDFTQVIAIGGSGEPTLFISDSSVDEGVGEVRVNICLNFPSTETVSFNHFTKGITATQFVDFGSSSGTLTIPAGELCTSLVVPIVDDSNVEAEEYFNIVINTVVGITASYLSGSIAILDNDINFTPTVALGTSSGTETAGFVSVNVCVDATTINEVTVGFSTTSQSAIAGEDFESVVGGVITIPAGFFCGAVSIPIIDDNLPEPNETFSLNLFNAVNANIGPANGVITIRDNDTGDCAVDISQDDGNLIISGLLDNPNLKIFTAGYASLAYECSPWLGSPCDETQVISGLPAGEYIVRYISDFPSSCNISETITLDNTSTGGCNVDISVAGNDVIISGLEDRPNVKIFTEGYASIAYECAPWFGSPCAGTQMITDLPEGNYIVRIISDAPSDCDISEFVSIGNSIQLFSTPNLMSFKAKKEGRQSEISWMMARDEKIDFYTIEVSEDARNWKILAEQNSSGLDATRHYTTTDETPVHGENFYRLKVNHVDGSFFYSNIRRLQFDIDFSEVIVYPNPTNDLIHLTLRDFVGKEGRVEIYNQLGQLQFAREYLSIPSNAVQVDVSRFVAGLYTVSIKVENQRSFAKQFVVGEK